MDWVAMPDTTVYVLPDGRSNWMEGETGVVVWPNEEWTSVEILKKISLFLFVPITQPINN
jgi:hypothetical protein